QPVVTIGRARVPLPPGSFLQATVEGEAALARLVLDHIGKAKRVADLFRSAAGRHHRPRACAAAARQLPASNGRRRSGFGAARAGPYRQGEARCRPVPICSRSSPSAARVCRCRPAASCKQRSKAKRLWRGSCWTISARRSALPTCSDLQPVVTIGRARVPLPPGSFLQATVEGEAALARLVLDHIGKAKRVADLFAGVGTFALRLAERARV